MGIRELQLGQTLLTQYPTSVSKYHFLNDLCAKWGLNNELICDYQGNLTYQRHVGGNYIYFCVVVWKRKKETKTQKKEMIIQKKEMTTPTIRWE